MTPPRKHFLVRGNHATAVSAGPMLEPGTVTDLVDPDDPHDAAQIAAGVFLELDGDGTEPAVTSDSTDEELLAFVKEATIPEVVACATDTQMAERLLTAENAATDGEPRKGVVEGLNAASEAKNDDNKESS